MIRKKITLNELKSLIKSVIKETYLNETEEEDSLFAERYVEGLFKEYGDDYTMIRQKILDNIVNNPYPQKSNAVVTKVWDEFNKRTRHKNWRSM